MMRVKRTFFALAYVCAFSIVGFIMLNALIASGIDGAYRHICVSGDMSGGLVLFLGFSLFATVPASVFIGCAVAWVKPQLTWKRLCYGLGAALASIVAAYVASYLGTVLLHTEQRACETRWTFAVPTHGNRSTT